MSIIAHLKALNVERIDAEDAIADHAAAKALIAGYGEFGVTPPSWLTDVHSKLREEIKRRHRDMQVARLRELEAQEIALLSRDEKRAAIQAEVAKLRDSLGTASAPNA